MTTDRSEMRMWDSDPSLTLHHMRDHVIRSMTQPTLTVLIPRRNVKVPHQKSKKLQQLQSKPRDPNASHSLLMVAPPNDCRYRSLMKTDQAGKAMLEAMQERQCNTNYSIQGHPMHTVTPKVAQQRLLHASQWLDGQAALSGTRVPGPGYLQQLSTIAAMAWSDCSQATEKLRRIYEQTSMLSRDPFSVMGAYASPYMTSSSVPTDMNKPQEFPRMHQHDVTKHSQTLLKQAEPERYWEMPSVYCACAVCEMTKRTKSNMTSHRRNGHSSKVMTSRINANTSQIDLSEQQCHPPVLTNSSKLKRSRSPEVTALRHQPPRKINKQEPYPVAQQLARDQSSAKGALLSYLKTKTNNTVMENTSQFAPNIFFAPSLQSSSSNPRDLMMTPSFENQCYVNPQVVNGNGAVGGGIFNGFTNFLPPKILNALE